MIRVCVVDDQTLVRRGIVTLLGLFEGIRVEAEADDGENGVAIVLKHRPDVLLLDVRMPKLNGIAAVKRLSELNALPPTLLLTTFEDDAALVSGIRAWAKGYLLKGVEPETLVEAIKTVAAGKLYLSGPSTAPARALDTTWAGETLDVPDRLTQRESDVLRLMAKGLANRDIADALQLSEGTVRNHVSAILAKFGVNDRTRAVLYAMQKQLV